MKKSLIIIISIVEVVAFVALLYVTQLFLLPIFPNDSTEMYRGYTQLKENSIDVIFMGSSQTYAGIDSGKITREGVEAYNFCASRQYVSMMPYYLQMALKTQTPKLVMVETYALFNDTVVTQDGPVAWNYSVMPPSQEKYDSLVRVLGGDKWQAFEYCYMPFFKYHNRWCEFDAAKFIKYNFPGMIDNANRGYFILGGTEKIDFSYATNYTKQRPVPEGNREDILKMVDMCSKKGIRIVFFKTPAGSWSKGDSMAAKKFMKDNRLTFIDLNEHLDEIGISVETDFQNANHLNASGAEKATNYIIPIIKKYMNQ